MQDSETRDETASHANACIHQLFERQVEHTPSAPAVSFGPNRITYRDLNRRANQLAHHLRARGVTRETVVGVSVERSLDMIVALIGVLKAGGGYVPLDPGYPSARLAFMIEDSRAAVILTHERLAARLPDAAPVVCLDRERADFEGQSEENPPCFSTPEDLAYVIYTSGTTGQPKGVAGLHRGAVNRFAWMWLAYPFTQDEVCCQRTSLNFVDSLSEIFVPLLRGIPTVIVPDHAARDPRRLVETLASEGVTRLVLVPSLLRAILAVPDDLRHRLATLRICVSSGEALPIELLRRFHERLPQTILLNLYGSTEVSADATCYDTRLMSDEATTVPLGRPIDNTRIYIVDDTLEPVPAGMSGELYVGGAGLARGYVNRPDLTAEKFIPDPFSARPNARLYKTGDRARWLPDGNIEFLGRFDHQVKIRGFRVELGEIEAALAAHQAIRQAVVIAREDGAGDTRLFAYVVPIDGSVPLTGLRDFCHDRLPNHMVPSAFVPLDTLPLTPSGKIDRSALPAAAPARSDVVGGTFIAPRTPVEDMLVAIWSDVLEIRQVGIDDDFFELGGHSLLAARLMQQMSDIFWMTLPLRLLFDAPTIAKMAVVVERRLEAHQSDEAAAEVLAINTSGTRPPFVFLHAAMQGNGFYCFNLARHLGEDQPMYALAPLGLDGNETPPTVEAIAAKQLQIIRRVQPRGPYYLGGFCASGPVAFELARMLRAASERVEVVVVIESFINECDEVVRFTDRAAGALARVAQLSPAQRLSVFHVARPWVRSVAQLAHSTVRGDTTAVVNNVRSVVSATAAILKRCRARAGDRGRTAPPASRQDSVADAVLRRYDRAIDGFVPQRYDGYVVALKAEASPFDSTAAWRKVAPHLRVQSIEGNHNTCITTRVGSLGAELRGVLREAQGGGSGTPASHCGAAAPIHPDRESVRAPA